MPPATVAISQASEPRLWKGRTRNSSMARPYSAHSARLKTAASHQGRPAVTQRL